MSSFIWGGSTGLSYEDMKQRQAFAGEMQKRGANARPRNAIEGLNSAANSVLGALLTNRLSKEEARRRDEYTANEYNPLTGGQQPQTASYTPFLPEAEAQPAGADAILSGLVQRGLPEHVAQGFVMNFQDESGLNPGINEQNPIVPGSRGGFGLAQWTGPRRVALEKFAAERGTQVSDLNTQLDFLMTELQGPEAAAARRILSAGDAGGAAAAIARDFLRPAQEHLNRRVAKYTGGGAAAPSGPDPRIMQAMSSPYATPGQRSVLGALLQQQMQASDPMRQLQMQRAQLELEQMQNPQVKPIEVGGVLLDPQTYEPLFDSRDPARPITPDERAQWGIPEDDKRPYAMTPKGPSLIGGSGVTVNNNMDDDKFGEAFAKGDATALSTVSEAGIAARRNVSRIDQLEALLSESPTGWAGIAKQAAGEWGIATEGLDNIQASQALINSLVPEQRQPGSGPMSDADLALFKQSLPRIINQPGGNATILQTMRAIAEYDAQGAEIVQRLRAGEISRAQAFAALQNRPNPLSGFKAPQGDSDSGGASEGAPANIASDEEYDQLPSGTVFVGPDGVARRKP